MKQHKRSIPTLKEVLGYFAAEANHEKATLDRYLEAYPDYVEELIDAAFEFGKPNVFDTASLNKVDLARIEAGRKQFLAASPKRAQDPLAEVEVTIQKRTACDFDLPRIVISDLLARRVKISTVPNGFLAKFAASLGFEEGTFRRNYAEQPLRGSLSYSYSSEVKPHFIEQIDFAKSLIDAGVSPDRVARIIAEG